METLQSERATDLLLLLHKTPRSFSRAVKHTNQVIQAFNSPSFTQESENLTTMLRLSTQQQELMERKQSECGLR